MMSETDLTVQPPFDRPPDQPGRVGAVKLVDRDNSCRGGHVDLGEPAAANDIDADEQQPATLEFGSESGADFLLASCQLSLCGRAADCEVGADLSFAGHTIDRARNLTVDKNDTLIALGYLRQELLDDMLLAIGPVEQLHQRREIAPFEADAEHRPAGEAVQRFDYDLAMLSE